MGEAPDPREQEDCPGPEVCHRACDQHPPAENDTGLAEHKPTVGALSGGLCCEADRDLPPGVDHD